MKCEHCQADVYAIHVNQNHGKLCTGCFKMENAIKQIKQDEGLRLKPYRCTAGKLTIAYGRNLEGRGITIEEAELMLTNDIVDCLADLRRVFAGFDTLNDNRKGALLNMRYQLGPNRFKGFKNMIAAIKQNDWPLALIEGMDSRWYKQVTQRADRVLKMFV